MNIFTTYTPVYTWNKESDKKIKVNQGGTFSSKTVSIEQNICELLLENPDWVATITSQSWPNLYRGALRDFKTLIKSSPILKKVLKNPNLVKGPFEFINGSILEFVTVKDFQDAKSGKRDILFLNEANGMQYAEAEELMRRAKYHIFIDFNPNVEFWVHHEVLTLSNADHIVSNFTHNPYLTEELIDSILLYRRKWKHYEQIGDEGKARYWKNKWYVYGLGLTGIVEGTIYESVNWVYAFPVDLDKRAYVIDWGYQNDPLALCLCGVKYSRDPEVSSKLYGKELIYETGLTTPRLIEKMNALGITTEDLIIADTNNWDGIGQLRDYGYRVTPAVKPPDSRKNGVKLILDYDLYITRDSYNWRKEQSNYKYIQKDGKFTDEPADGDDHCWDCLRYFGQTILIKNRSKKQRSRNTRKTKLITHE